MLRFNRKLFPLFLLTLLALGACKSVEVRDNPHGSGLAGYGHSLPAGSGSGSSVQAEVLELSAGLQLDQIIPRIADRRVVYVGETHDRYGDHLVQLEIVRKLHQENSDIAIGMEFFQQPYQPHLDDYVKGATTEPQMLAATEWYKRWRYDFRLYRPLLDYARQNGIPVIALNAPTETVSRVSKVGFEGLTEEERAGIPAEIDDSDQAYRHRLHDIYMQHGRLSGNSFDRFAQVQLLWDETMAERVANYLARHPKRQMVVLAGSGHLMHGAGIPKRVARRQKVDDAILLPGHNIRVQPGVADFIIFPKPVGLPKAGRMGVMLAEAEQGVKVARVGNGSAGERAGLKANDIIQQLDGSRVQTSSDIKIAMLGKVPGDVIRLQVLRKRMLLGEQQLDFEFELGE